MTEAVKRSPRVSAGAMVAILLGAAVISLGAAFAIKSPCLRSNWGPPDYIQYRKVCYSDLQALYGERNLDTLRFPYVEETSYEYPVVIGLEMWVAANFANTHDQFFTANIPFLALSALLALAGLIGAVGARPRVLWYALGSPLIFYAFHNWDLLAVAPLALGMWAWGRRRDGWAGAALGIGAAAKIFPGYAVPALLVARLREPGSTPEDRRRAALKIVGGSAAGYLIPNVPVILADTAAHGSPVGWLGVFKFHSKRTPDFGTTWYWMSDRLAGPGRPDGLRILPVLAVIAVFFTVAGLTAVAASRGHARRYDGPCILAAGLVIALVTAVVMFGSEVAAGPASPAYKAVIDDVSLGLFALGFMGLLVLQWVRRLDPWTIAGAMITLFLLTSKVHSPQYAIWLVAFFVVVNVPWWLIVPYLAADAVLLYSGFYWFATSPSLQPNGWQSVFVWSVYSRAGALAGLLWWFTLRGHDLIRGPGGVDRDRIGEPPVADFARASGQALDGEEEPDELAPASERAV